MKVEKRLTEAPEKGSVSEEYFYRMLSPQAVKHSSAYNREEENVVRRWLAKNPFTRAMNFVAVGAGELWYLKYALQYTRRYVCVEPLADIFLNDSVEWLVRKTKSIVLLKKKFGDVKPREIPRGKSVYVFLFNILAYIEDPIVGLK